MPTPHRPSRPRAFTLIELLVVIAVIALLIGILLPSLRQGRDTARMTVCTSNIRMFGVAANLYAKDYKDRLWDDLLRNSAGNVINDAAGSCTLWARLPRQGSTLRDPGYLYWYVENVDKVGECPSNKRRNSSGEGGSNMFGGETNVDFDFTMISKMRGLQLGSGTRVAVLASPAIVPGVDTIPPLTPPAGAALERLSGIPIFVEESTRWYNEVYRDGLWGNWDQIDTRHFGSGSVVYIEGHAGPLKPPQGRLPLTAEPQDMQANDLYVANNRGWVRMEHPTAAQRPYGWANNPK